MKRRLIPNTNLEVSVLSLGTMTFGTPVGETDAIQLTHWAMAHGINFIDTANMYEGYTRYVGSPGGVSEEILGKALASRRGAAVVATKVGMKIGAGEYDQGLSRQHVMAAIDNSLRRLQTDYVDLYYMHKPDPATPFAESVQAFDDLIKAGKIRYWGISNFTAQQIAEVLELCNQNGYQRPVALQPAYSLLKRDVEREILPLCQHEQIAVVPYQVLQGGVLSGKYRRGEAPPPGSRQVEKPEWTLALSDDLFQQLDAVAAEAEARDRTLLQHALLALLEQPAVVSLIVGAKRTDQIEAMIDAVVAV